MFVPYAYYLQSHEILNMKVYGVLLHFRTGLCLANDASAMSPILYHCQLPIHAARIPRGSRIMLMDGIILGFHCSNQRRVHLQGKTRDASQITHFHTLRTMFQCVQETQKI